MPPTRRRAVAAGTGLGREWPSSFCWGVRRTRYTFALRLAVRRLRPVCTLSCTGDSGVETLIQTLERPPEIHSQDTKRIAVPSVFLPPMNRAFSYTPLAIAIRSSADAHTEPTAFRTRCHLVTRPDCAAGISHIPVRRREGPVPLPAETRFSSGTGSRGGSRNRHRPANVPPF